MYAVDMLAVVLRCMRVSYAIVWMHSLEKRESLACLVWRACEPATLGPAEIGGARGDFNTGQPGRQGFSSLSATSPSRLHHNGEPPSQHSTLHSLIDYTLAFTFSPPRHGDPPPAELLIATLPRSSAGDIDGSSGHRELSFSGRSTPG